MSSAAKCALIMFFVGLYRITQVSLRAKFRGILCVRARKSDFHKFTKQLFVNFALAMTEMQDCCITENAIACYPSYFFSSPLAFPFLCSRNMRWHEGVTEEASPWI